MSSEFRRSSAAADHSPTVRPGERWKSFQSTWLRIETPRGLVEVQPAPRHTRTGEFAGGMACRSVHVVTAWNPGGVAQPPEENDRRHVSLGRQVVALGIHAWAAAGVAPDGTLAEASYAVPDLDRSLALELGRQCGQLAIFEWTPGGDGLRIVRCDTGRAYRSGWASARLEFRPCPMRPPGEHAADLCKRPGGPWVAASMRVATEFTVLRSTLLRALGCDVCHGGPVLQAGPGTPILIAPTQDPSRNETSVWAPRTESRR